MKRFALVAAVLMMASLCGAQTMPPREADPHAGMQDSPGVVPSSRTEFGMACGIRDTSAHTAMRFSLSPAGEWSAMSAEQRTGPGDSAIARVWRETNWMVDMHDALGQGMATMHTSQMCFDERGQITYMLDRYMDMQSCGCVRFTAMSFNASGTVSRREQRFVNASTGDQIATPQSAQEFPEVYGFRRLEQLPFYSLIKR